MLRTLLCAAAMALPVAALAQDGARTPAAEGAEVFLIAPADGATVTSPVTLQFGLRNKGVAPADVDWPNTGHHHLFINVDPATHDAGTAIPATENILHFGGGQTQATLDLPAGTHTVWLLLGDHNHVPHDPPVVSAPVTFTVH
jgi:hypothetical protein